MTEGPDVRRLRTEPVRAHCRAYRLTRQSGWMAEGSAEEVLSITESGQVRSAIGGWVNPGGN
jgi:hypothetical protein